MIYDQEGGTCAGFAIANAIEHVTGKIPKSSEVYNLYEEYDEGPQGMRLTEVMELLEIHPWAGVKVKDHIEIWHILKRKLFPNPMGKIREYLLKQKQGWGVVVAIRIREGKPQFPLDENGVLKPRTTRVKDVHAVFLAGIRKNLLFLENSWGSDFGQLGYFYLRVDDLSAEVHSIYAIQFDHDGSSKPKG